MDRLVLSRPGGAVTKVRETARWRTILAICYSLSAVLNAEERCAFLVAEFIAGLLEISMGIDDTKLTRMQSVAHQRAREE